MHVKTVCIKQTPPKMHENHGIFYNPEKNTTKKLCEGGQRQPRLR